MKGRVTRLVLAAAIALATVAPAGAAGLSPRGRVYRTAPPMDQTVSGRILPQLDGLMDQLISDKAAMTVDGVKVFQSNDRFLPGKIAVGLTYPLLATPRTDPAFKTRLAGYRALADLTVDQANDTWGIYYYMEALWMLKKAGLLDQAVSPETLAKLRTQLDWRTFVRPDLTLIDLPNNYYGVAFSIARLRMLMGWENETGSQALMAKTLDHYRRYSGVYGFADETDGDGRFDRYSILLIGEISQRLIETGVAPPPEVKVWLRKSVDLMLPRFNTRGEGVEYGRSIGAYGETCFLEVMTAAAKFGLLTPKERTMAYAFSSRIAARYADFWYDPQMRSVNLWEHGRRTDDYRGKHRILGENLSLARQYIYTDAIWNDLGFKGATPEPGYGAWLKTLPTYTVTWFAKGTYDRMLLTLRDGDRVIGLPLISGAAGLHVTSPYFPIPFSPGMLMGVPNGMSPLLTPRLTLADGSALMPLAFFRDIKVARAGRRTTVTYRQDEMDRTGKDAPVADDRIAVDTTYVFEPGRITRTDTFTPKVAVAVRGADLEFGTFSGAPHAVGLTTRFSEGAVRSFKATGLDDCRTRDVVADKDYHTPVGALTTAVTCHRGAFSLTKPWSLSWSLDYAPTAPAS